MKRFFGARHYPIRWSFAILVCLAVIGMAWWTGQRLTVETDIINALPKDDPVIADARRVIAHHPLQDRIAVDLSCHPHDPDRLLEGAAFVERRLRASGLFQQVGMDEVMGYYPELLSQITDNLPVLFSETELRERVLPLLDAGKIRSSLQAQIEQLQQFEGIGQARFIAADPLGLRNVVLARLSPLAPGRDTKLVRGRLVSADGRHTLLTAEPAAQATDSSFARQATRLLADIAADLRKQYASTGIAFTLTSMGAYRAALDNETMAKSDTRRAVLFSTLAIIMLLLVGFPRPLIGMLALPPAFAGTIAGLFVFSFFQPSISMLALGFGGAIISFTVDYGIAYLLFLDRPYETGGLDASREVWTLGLLAMLTTAASFVFLFISGFPALAQLGVFAALGVLFTFIFVHAVYPFVFPKMPSARRDGFAPFKKTVLRITSARMPAKIWAALALFVVMLFFAKPVFHADLNAMNSLSDETKAAEALVRSVWGDILSRIYVMSEGRTLEEVRDKGDRLTALIEKDVMNGVIATAFLPSMVFPGKDRAARHFVGWRTFWTPERIAETEKNLTAAAREAGFAADAFTPFLALLKTNTAGAAPEIPPALYPLMGIAQDKDDKTWRLYATLASGQGYNSDAFYRRLAAEGSARLFDPVFFGQRLSGMIMKGFLKVTLIVGLLTLAVVFLYLLDIPLTLTACAPTVFALVCTLGTLNLLGEPLGIPTIMIAAIVIGMGTDYALYLIVAWQRYMDDGHPLLALIRMSISLSFATTFLGFIALSLATHAMLKSIGLTLLFGIGFSFLGTVLIVPPLAARLFTKAPWPRERVAVGSKDHARRVIDRYRHMQAYTRLFARFKMRLDPMFPRLAEFAKQPRIILDVGCGFGIPAAWLLALHPEAQLFGIDPDQRRIQAAARVMGERGVLHAAAAPDIPHIPEAADTVLLLDIIHMLTDEDLRLTLERLRGRMHPGSESVLVLRCTVPQKDDPSLERWLEHTRLRLTGAHVHFRTADEVALALTRAGFRITLTEPSPDKELYWFIANPAA